MIHCVRNEGIKNTCAQTQSLLDHLQVKWTVMVQENWLTWTARGCILKWTCKYAQMIHSSIHCVIIEKIKKILIFIKYLIHVSQINYSQICILPLSLASGFRLINSVSWVQTPQVFTALLWTRTWVGIKNCLGLQATERGVQRSGKPVWTDVLFL